MIKNCVKCQSSHVYSFNKGYWTCPKIINPNAGNISLLCIASSCDYRGIQSSATIWQMFCPEVEL